MFKISCFLIFFGVLSSTQSQKYFQENVAKLGETLAKIFSGRSSVNQKIERFLQDNPSRMETLKFCDSNFRENAKKSHARFSPNKLFNYISIFK